MYVGTDLIVCFTLSTENSPKVHVIYIIQIDLISYATLEQIVTVMKLPIINTMYASNMKLWEIEA